MDMASLRALFPATSRAAYLNAAAASPIALPVEQAISLHYREAVERGDVGFRAWLARKEEVRRKLAAMIGARADEVAFTPSTSVGMHAAGVLLQGLGVREVLTLEGEFPSTTVPLLHLGLRLRILRPRPDGSCPVDDIASALRRGTGAVALSAVQYASGWRMDLAALGRLCRRERRYLVINGAQALGQIPIDVKAHHVDVLCAPSHKWLFGGYGTGVFFARKALFARVPPAFAGWVSLPSPMAMDNLAGSVLRGKRASSRVYTASGVKVRRDPPALEAGGGAFGPLFGLEAALDLHAQLGIHSVEAHNARLQRLLRDGLRSRGFVPTAPDQPEGGSGICVYQVDRPPEVACRELAARGVVTTPRAGGVRVSTHAFNSEEDLDRLFWAIDALGIRLSR